MPDSPEKETETELNCFFVEAKKHDRDRIEILFGFDGLIDSNHPTFNYVTHTALFTPKTLSLPSFEQKLKEDFQSYVRLHTQASNPKSDLGKQRVIERLKILRQDPTEEVFQNFAIDFQSFLKANDKKIRQKLRKLSKKNLEKKGNIRRLKDIEDEIHEVTEMIEDFRKLIQDVVNNPDTPSILKDLKKDFQLLDEYISHIYVQYIGDLYEITFTVDDLNDFAELLTDYSRSEASYRQKQEFLLDTRDGNKSTQKMELYSRRIALLKKYFQRPLYLTDQVSRAENKLLIPVYGLAAAMAASWAIMVQLYQFTTFGERLGINTIAFISIAVAGYVAKDIMKDFMRKYLMKKGGKFLPEETHKLFLDHKGKKKSVGIIGERFILSESDKISPAIRQWRYPDNSGSRIEKSLTEDVLIVSKKVKLRTKYLSSEEAFPWGFREVFRMRLDRFLTQLDEPFRPYYFVSEEGLPTKKQSHRVYQLTLGVWIAAGKKQKSIQPIAPIFKAFLISLDKTGILDCTELKTKAEYTPPVPKSFR